MNPRFVIKVTPPKSARSKQAEIEVYDQESNGRLLFTHEANLRTIESRKKASLQLQTKLQLEEDNAEAIERMLEAGWAELVENEKTKKPSTATQANTGAIELLEDDDDGIRRPLCLIGEHAYAATWLSARRQVITQDGAENENIRPLVIVRSDGAVFSDVAELPIEGLLPLAMLNVAVNLPVEALSKSKLSKDALINFLKGDRPNVLNVFRNVARVVDEFVDFDYSLAAQETMCHMTACWIIGTFFLGAFDIAGYLWANGETGAGKSRFVATVAELAYLGEMILDSSTFATIRNLTEYGAALAFDDAENVTHKRHFDADKKSLILAGNHRGVYVPLNEKTTDGRWEMRRVHAFSPKLFSAIRIPDGPLASRSITIRLVRTDDAEKAARNLNDPNHWPAERRQLVDDLWLTGLLHLRQMRQFSDEAARRSALCGRDLEPWRAILAVAHWLEEGFGLQGLFARMNSLAVTYHDERDDLEVDDVLRILVRALFARCYDKASEEIVQFSPKELAAQMNVIAAHEGITSYGEQITNDKKLGWRLKRLPFRKLPNRSTKIYGATKQLVEHFARAYRICLDERDHTPQAFAFSRLATDAAGGQLQNGSAH